MSENNNEEKKEEEKQIEKEKINKENNQKEKIDYYKTDIEKDENLSKYLDEDKKIKPKYRLNFSKIIKSGKSMSGEKENYSEIEYNCNICLNSSLIDKANKINALTLLSFINYNNNFYNILFYLNNRIFKYLGKDKGIEAFIFIRTLYRASNILMDNYKNYFYSYYYVKLAEIIKDKSKIDKESIILLLKLIKKVKTGTEEYLKIKQKLFVETLNKEKVNYIKNILNSIEKDNNNNKDENLYYVINKEWLDKAYNFINEYERTFNLNKEEFNNFIEKSFNFENVYSKYIGEEKTNIIINEEDKDFPFFPGPIDNYSITVFKDFWNDNDNIQDNYFIKDNLILNKDYYLINKEIWNELNNIFQSTNEIRRIGNDNDLFVLKCIIFENNLRNKDYVNHLRRKYIQISKKNSVYDLKIKILRAINKMIKTTLLLKKNIKFHNDYKENKLTEDDTNKIDENLKKKRINFYECSYDKKDILSEMIIAYANSIKSIYYDIKKLDINESILMENFPINGLRKNNSLLLIEIKDEKEDNFLNEITNKCLECKKEIKKEEEYKCEKCHINEYCCLKCSKENKNHIEIHKYLDAFLIEEFNLKKLFQTNLKNIILKNSNHGISGLYNLGNTCFMNSIIQCLSNTEDLTKYFLLDYYEQEMNLGNRLGSNGNLAESYSKLIKLLWNNKNNEAINPDFFIIQIMNKLNQYRSLNQQDAHEFLSLLLDSLHEDINRIINKPYIELKEQKENENDEEASYRWWKSHRLRDNSIISDLFYGQLKCNIKCLNCNRNSITYSPFMFLPLNLPIISHKVNVKFFYNKNCYFISFLIGVDSKIFDFKNQCFELNVLKNSHIEKNLFLIDAVVLDKDKIIYKIIKDDEELVYNYLKEGKEIILFLKESLNSINIYCYPILTYIEEYIFFKSQKINFLSYPIAISVNNDTTIENLKQRILLELEHMFYKNSNNNFDLLIYHNFKEKGFNFNFFSTKPTCEFCHQRVNQSPFCNINEHFKEKEKIINIKKQLQNNRPLILLIRNDNYKDKSAYINSNMSIKNYISKPIKENAEISSIYNSLEYFKAEEKLNDNEWYCNKCKDHKPALKKLNIYRAPNYLVITLKRFKIRNGIKGQNYGRKNEIFINYPINDLDLSKYIIGQNNSNAIYNLYGVVEHFGGLTQGHYIAKCKNFGKWFKFNDQNVEEINENNIEKSIVSKNAYLLFYKRKLLDNEF